MNQLFFPGKTIFGLTETLCATFRFTAYRRKVEIILIGNRHVLKSKLRTTSALNKYSSVFIDLSTLHNAVRFDSVKKKYTR